MKLYRIIFMKLQQMMNVLYYYIYLFNVKFLPYTFSDSNTVWMLGSLFALIVNSLLNIGLAYFFRLYFRSFSSTKYNNTSGDFLSL